jgi:NADH-quinone oxidoreductase subunit E
MDRDKIQEIVTRHRHEKASLLAILHEVQQQDKQLAMDSLKYISEILAIPFAHLYGLATFYSAFSTSEKGRTEIRVCDGIACRMHGADEVFDALKPALGVDEGQTTPDREYSLERVHCQGLCSIGPNAALNEKVYSRLSREKIMKILSDREEK